MSQAPLILTALRGAYPVLSAVSDSPQLDAQLLLAHVLGVERSTLLAYPERDLTLAQHAAFTDLVAQAGQGVPIPYLTGTRAFYKHDFFVTPDVLIPRPETEHLVEAALAWVKAHHPQGQGLTLVDVGTGSGAIAVSLAAELLGAAVHATDVSPAALAVARHNAANIGVKNIQFHEGDLLDALPPDVTPDLIAANLPYIDQATVNELPVAQHEPRLALDGGPDGLDLIRLLLAQSVTRVPVAFCLLLEIGADQGAGVCQLCEATFSDAQVRLIQDYAGLDRLVEVTR